MRALLDRLYAVSGGIAASCIVAICVVVMAQVMLNLADRIAAAFFGGAIGLTIPSYSDFTGFFLAAASFLALAYTFRAGGHIRVTLVIGLLPEGVQRWVEIGCVAIAAAVGVFATWYAVALTHESFVYNDLSSGMVAVPIWIPQAAMTGGLIVLSIALIDDLICQLAGKPASYAGKGEGLLEAAGGE
ncbi:MAG: membrane protein [marine bacterium B5-7]|nr:MAG: membrane protein [marine bacterium B5-7]